MEARHMFVPVDHRALGTLPLVNTPVKLSRTPAGIRGSSPDMGQHSREVLRERLGLSEAELDALAASQVVWEERPPVDLG
jgi:crotonobetainyl-CoA:carnitine CoA-transferase CaiB-like acyl-CoA transferase